MYGGKQRNDEKAAKAACNERKGWLSYFHTKNTPVNGSKLHYPLLSIIQYKGFTLSAVSVLPIGGGSSLVYGSADAGRHVLCSDPTVKELMKNAARSLNLAGHKISYVTIFGPGDIEVHKGSDNRYYLLDFGRVMPPEYSTAWGSRSVFFNLLRPSLVKKFPDPLCSDAFTAWMGKPSSTSQKLESSVINATKALYAQQIPKMAARLDAEFIQKKMEVSAYLVPTIHRMGINCRHLGFIRRQVLTQGVRKLILTECVARVMKNEVRQLLREKMCQLKVSTDIPYKKVVFQYLKSILEQESRVPTTFTKASGIEINGKTIKTTGTAKERASGTTALGNTWTTEPFYYEVTVLSKCSTVSIGLALRTPIVVQDCYIDEPEAEQESPFETISVNYQVQGNQTLFLAPGKQPQNFTRELQAGDVFGFYYSGLNSDEVWITTNGIPQTSLKLPQNERRQITPYINLHRGASVKSNFGPLEHFCFGLPKFLYDHGFKDPVLKQKIPESQDFWKGRLKKLLISSFPNSLFPFEENENFNLRRSVNMPLLVAKFSEMSAIHLSDRISNRLIQDPKGRLTIHLHDIVSLGSRASTIGVVDLVSVMSVFEDPSSHSVNRALLYQMLEKIVRVIDASGSDLPIHYYYWGRLYIELAAQTTNPKTKMRLLKDAQDKFETITKTENIFRDTEDPYIALIFVAAAFCFLGQARIHSSEVCADQATSAIFQMKAILSAAVVYDLSCVASRVDKELAILRHEALSLPFSSFVGQAAEAMIESLPVVEQLKLTPAWIELHFLIFAQAIEGSLKAEQKHAKKRTVAILKRFIEGSDQESREIALLKVLERVLPLGVPHLKRSLCFAIVLVSLRVTQLQNHVATRLKAVTFTGNKVPHEDVLFQKINSVTHSIPVSLFGDRGNFKLFDLGLFHYLFQFVSAKDWSSVLLVSSQFRQCGLQCFKQLILEANEDWSLQRFLNVATTSTNASGKESCETPQKFFTLFKTKKSNNSNNESSAPTFDLPLGYLTKLEWSRGKLEGTSQSSSLEGTYDLTRNSIQFTECFGTKGTKIKFDGTIEFLPKQSLKLCGNIYLAKSNEKELIGTQLVVPVQMKGLKVGTRVIASLAPGVITIPTTDGLTFGVHFDDETFAMVPSTQIEIDTKALSSPPSCTFFLSGKTYPKQTYYRCLTCWPESTKDRYGVCKACLIQCHAGHATAYYNTGPFYCDCGAGSSSVKCACLNNIHPLHIHPLHKVEPLKDSGWACDGRSRKGACRSNITGFHQTKGMNRWSCLACGFDLCEKCVVDRSCD